MPIALDSGDYRGGTMLRKKVDDAQHKTSKPPKTNVGKAGSLAPTHKAHTPRIKRKRLVRRISSATRIADRTAPVNRYNIWAIKEVIKERGLGYVAAIWLCAVEIWGNF